VKGKIREGKAVKTRERYLLLINLLFFTMLLFSRRSFPCLRTWYTLKGSDPRTENPNACRVEAVAATFFCHARPCCCWFILLLLLLPMDIACMQSSLQCWVPRAPISLFLCSMLSCVAAASAAPTFALFIQGGKENACQR
jgi:hypothetical protein